MDLAQLFDQIHHDRLIARVGEHLPDRRILRVTGKTLRTGVLANGLITRRARAGGRNGDQGWRTGVVQRPVDWLVNRGDNRAARMVALLIDIPANDDDAELAAFPGDMAVSIVLPTTPEALINEPFT